MNLQAEDDPVSLVTTSQCPEQYTFLDIVKRFSSLQRLVRVVARIKRYLFNFRNKNQPRHGSFTAQELEDALICCVLQTQRLSLVNDYKLLQKGKVASSRFQKLSPFIDEATGAIRVGGRIKYAFLPQSGKHPLLLPKDCHLASLIVESYHKMLLHAGPRTTQCFIQRKFWIISLNSLVRKLIHRCIRCHRMAAKPNQPIMADLPSKRLETVRAFNKVATDFCGPFTTKDSTLRNSRRTVKTYMLIIVCMSTKAVYCDLSTPAFLAALTRFTSRRGLPVEIFSDQGRNFLGAARYLKQCSDFLKENSETIFSHLASQGIQWSFNVPLASNMAGLHEAAVKAAKRLLNRQVGDTVLSFEEFTTLCCRVEAVLNSRPLGHLSVDPLEAIDVLTPGHFLVGAPLLAPPEQIINEDERVSNRWKRLQQITQGFWNRWTKEYVHTMLSRQKWHKPCENLRVGQIVYMMDTPSTPLSWPLARVERLLPSRDGVVRSVYVKTQNGLYCRPVNKLVALPAADK